MFIKELLLWELDICELDNIGDMVLGRGLEIADINEGPVSREGWVSVAVVVMLPLFSDVIDSEDIEDESDVGSLFFQSAADETELKPKKISFTVKVALQKKFSKHVRITACHKIKTHELPAVISY